MYLALYRKYRPKTFNDVISQDHITTTLKNQIINGSAAHAYLFTGSRGTGKTTCAKILAMAVNCLDPKDGSPCLECERCREILDDSATDIVEMDAASNNGVNDVRQLRDEVVYTPVSCKFRVYIIDEAHMLSPEAFNALLKTLEEPPPHVKFILATTELHKVPATISSRCQRFEFRRVNIADSAERLLEVAEKEDVSLERDAAELISRLSDGGMRDALSILDRCISADTHITSEVVRACAGVADRKHLFAFSEMIARKDTAGCIRLLGELYRNSKDIALIVDELSGQFRDMMLYKTAPNDRDLLTALPDEYDTLAEIAGMFSLGDILRCLTLLQRCADGIGRVKQRKTLAEMCFVRMCMGESPSALVSDVQTKAGQNVSSAPGTPIFEVKEIPEERPVPVTKPVEQMSQAERINSMKTRALLEETAKLAQAPIPPKPQTPPEAPAASAVRSEVAEKSAVNAPSAPSQPDFPEPPPFDDSYIPPLDDDYPIPSPGAPAAKPAVKPDTGGKSADVSAAVPDAPSQNAEVKASAPKRPKRSGEEKPSKKTKLPKITQDEWLAAVDKLAETDFVLNSLLQGSSAKTDEGELVIRSSNSLLLNNVKGDEALRVEKLLAEVLGFPAHIRLEAEEAGEETAEQSKLDALLNKARQLGIEVNIKK